MNYKYLSALVLAGIILSGGCDKVNDNMPEPPEIITPEPDPEPDTIPEPEPEPEPGEQVFNELIAGSLSIATTGGAPIQSKETYVDCTVSILHSNKEWTLDSVEAGIRGRGNSSWEWYPKKPYRIKFKKKQSLLGLGEAKSWVLLAEYRDPTDLMNAFVFELGQLMGLPFTNHNRFVEVTLNGEYIGLYHLTEQVQQGKSRVNIDEDNGFLISLDRDDGPELAPKETDNFWSQVYGMPVCVKNPDEPSANVLNSAKTDLGNLESAIKGGNWSSINEQLNVATMIDFLIVQELVYNVELDAPRSMYMHKDVGGKWAMGPLWDFDAGFDFDWGTMYTGHKFFTDYKELVLGTNPKFHTGTIYHVPEFFSDLFKIPEFVEAYKDRWNQVADMVTVAWDAAYSYYKENEEAFAREANRWPIDVKYETEIKKMQYWLINRRNYLSTIIKNY